MNPLMDLMAEERPRMDIPASRKDGAYAARMVRADASSVNASMIVKMHKKAWLAEKAYAGQTMTQEDYDTFFLDDTMNPRGRTYFNFNLVKPIVEQFRGTALQNTFSASVQPVTHRTETRRMAALGEQMLMHSLSELSPEMDRIVRSRVNIGRTMDETRGLFEARQWADPYTRAMNHLLARMLEISEINRYASDDMLRFVLWGVLPKIAQGRGSHFRWDHIHPSQFFWDTECKSFHMEDAAFKGVFRQMSMPRIAEDWNVDQDTLKDIESSIHAYGPSGRDFRLMNRMHVRVTSDYWTDVMYQEFGYMMLHDVPTLVRVGEREDGLNDNPISHNDLIDPPDTEENRELFGGRKTRKSHVECIRFADMVLWEDMAGISVPEHHKDKFRNGNMPDLVLDHGVWSLQEYNPYDPAYARNPVKSVMFAQVGGEVVSPIQAVLDPNRFMDRIASAIEQQANNSGGRSPIIDMDQIDPALDAGEVELRLKNGRMVEARTNGRGVGGVVGTYDSSMGQGVFSMLQIMNATEDLIRKVTGVNSTFAGEAQKDMRNGVTNALIQRGALMMQPVHSCIEDLDMQMCRCMATAGKEWYLEHPDVLQDLVTDADMSLLYQGRDFALERFNVQIRRDDPDQVKVKEANAWLEVLIQRGLIDRTRYADLYGRSHVEDVAVAVREYTAELMQAENEQRRDMAREQIMTGLSAKDQELQGKEDQAYADQVENARIMAKEGLRATAGMDRDTNREAAKAEREAATPRPL